MSRKKAITRIPIHPCAYGHMERYKSGACVECLRLYRRGENPKPIRKVEEIRKDLVKMLEAQLTAQKDRWGFL